ncbi:hypothetical protein H5410_050903 [Solanum commersonii]|uniref:Uncharacterized protein n=1 Tax=Solanum commersonii TaxID=4109 RepID=A0A9J5WYZ0_SOLCO|nr:hypothetical protein H5410_050903 [Solanum commersonii]
MRTHIYSFRLEGLRLEHDPLQPITFKPMKAILVVCGGYTMDTFILPQGFSLDGLRDVYVSPSTLGLAIAAKLQERVRNYPNKSIEVRLQKKSAEPVGKLCTYLGDSPSAMHRGYKVQTKGEQEVFWRDAEGVRRPQALTERLSILEQKAISKPIGDSPTSLGDLQAFISSFFLATLFLLAK